MNSSSSPWPETTRTPAGGGDRPADGMADLKRQRGFEDEILADLPRPTGASLPDHADTPRDRQIVTSRHGQPDLAPSPNVTRHKIRARAPRVSSGAHSE